MTNLIENYVNAKKALLDHVGLEPDWVECVIDDTTEMYWQLRDDSVMYAEKPEYFDDGEYEYYQDEIYTQRFYSKHVFRGEKYTLIFCDPHVDGMRWWRIFLNDHEIGK